VVAEVADDVAAEVELAGEGAGGAVWLMKLRPEAPRAGKKATTKRAAKKAAEG
jgi:glycine cleavage system H lipoate-binding protein